MKLLAILLAFLAADFRPAAPSTGTLEVSIQANVGYAVALAVAEVLRTAETAAATAASPPEPR